jgi:hypothetical protein
MFYGYDYRYRLRQTRAFVAVCIILTTGGAWGLFVSLSMLFYNRHWIEGGWALVVAGMVALIPVTFALGFLMPIDKALDHLIRLHEYHHHQALKQTQKIDGDVAGGV